MTYYPPLPLKANGDCEIVRLGEAPVSSVSSEYVYPLHFYARQRFQDWVFPSSNVEYDCIIGELAGSPIFVIKNPRDPGAVLLGTSPLEVWTKVLQRTKVQRTFSDREAHEHFGLVPDIVLLLKQQVVHSQQGLLATPPPLVLHKLSPSLVKEEGAEETARLCDLSEISEGTCDHSPQQLLYSSSLTQLLQPECILNMAALEDSDSDVVLLPSPAKKRQAENEATVDGTKRSKQDAVQPEQKPLVPHTTTVPHQLTSAMPPPEVTDGESNNHKQQDQAPPQQPLQQPQPPSPQQPPLQLQLSPPPQAAPLQLRLPPLQQPTPPPPQQLPLPLQPPPLLQPPLPQQPPPPPQPPQATPIQPQPPPQAAPQLHQAPQNLSTPQQPAPLQQEDQIQHFQRVVNQMSELQEKQQQQIEQLSLLQQTCVPKDEEACHQQSEPKEEEEELEEHIDEPPFTTKSEGDPHCRTTTTTKRTNGKKSQRGRKKKSWSTTKKKSSGATTKTTEVATMCADERIGEGALLNISKEGNVVSIQAATTNTGGHSEATVQRVGKWVMQASQRHKGPQLSQPQPHITNKHTPQQLHSLSDVSDPSEDCVICGGGDWSYGNDIVYCTTCNRGYHQQCGDIRTIPRDGYWYCRDCELRHKRDGQLELSAKCAVCGSGESSSKNDIVLCDKCSQGWHQKCANLATVPEGEWLCLPCLRKLPKGKRAQYIYCGACGKGDSPKGNAIVICEKCDRGWHQECGRVPVIPQDAWFCQDCRKQNGYRKYCSTCKGRALTHNPIVHCDICYRGWHRLCDNISHIFRPSGPSIYTCVNCLEVDVNFTALKQQMMRIGNAPPGAKTSASHTWLSRVYPGINRTAAELVKKGKQGYPELHVLLKHVQYQAHFGGVGDVLPDGWYNGDIEEVPDPKAEEKEVDMVEVLSVDSA